MLAESIVPNHKNIASVAKSYCVGLAAADLVDQVLGAATGLHHILLLFLVVSFLNLLILSDLVLHKFLNEFSEASCDLQFELELGSLQACTDRKSAFVMILYSAEKVLAAVTPRVGLSSLSEGHRVVVAAEHTDHFVCVISIEFFEVWGDSVPEDLLGPIEDIAFIHHGLINSELVVFVLTPSVHGSLLC